MKKYYIWRNGANRFRMPEYMTLAKNVFSGRLFTSWGLFNKKTMLLFDTQEEAEIKAKNYVHDDKRKLKGMHIDSIDIK